MQKFFIFNHSAEYWNHPWNQIQTEYFKNQGYEVIERRVNAIDADDYALGKELEGGIALANWADTIAIGLSNLKDQFDFKLIVYIRSYEISSNFIKYILWHNVDAVIAINTFKYDLLKEKGATFLRNFNPDKLHYLRNPFDINGLPFKDRKPGYFVGQNAIMSIKKGAGILAEYAVRLIDHDPKYRIRIIGGFGCQRATNLIKYLVQKDWRMQPPYFQYWGHTERDMCIKFLDKLNFVICTSVDEGDPNFVKEAMAMGIKVIIRAFPGAFEMFPNELVCLSIDEMIYKMEQEPYESEKYRQWVKDTSDINLICGQLHDVIRNS